MLETTFQVTVNEFQANTIRKICQMHPHELDIKVRKDAKEYWFEGDFIYQLKEASNDNA